MLLSARMTNTEVILPIIPDQQSTCQVAITEKLIKLLPQSCDSGYLLVSRIDKAMSRDFFHSSKRVFVTTLGD